MPELLLFASIGKVFGPLPRDRSIRSLDLWSYWTAGLPVDEKCLAHSLSGENSANNLPGKDCRKKILILIRAYVCYFTDTSFREKRWLTLCHIDKASPAVRREGNFRA